MRQDQATLNKASDTAAKAAAGKELVMLRGADTDFIDNRIQYELAVSGLERCLVDHKAFDEKYAAFTLQIIVIRDRLEAFAKKRKTREPRSL